MMKKIILIEGMGCEHCTRKVEDALRKIEGVSRVTVSLDKKNALVELNKDITDEVLKKAIEELDYEVLDIKER